MIATKHTHQPVSARLEGDIYGNLEEMLSRYPLFSRSQMVSEALRYWLADALKYGVDTNLQPLKPKGKA